ncbi:MAG: sensor domain-containing diguanylate cyclase [Deltaproteobacteria bacterium]|nr:sensor domain-containing diguanylate cyclase [Deltaproteobacteria bacterium]
MRYNDDFYSNLLDGLHDGVYFVDLKRRIQYWNQGAERISGYDAGDVMGARCMDGILMHVDEKGVLLCTKRCPLKRAMEDGKPRSKGVYLLHSSGHRVPARISVSPIRDGKGQIVGGVETFHEDKERLDVLHRVRELESTAFLDPVCKVANRRQAEMVVDSTLREFKRYGWPFGLLFMDIDRFKRINDTNGHRVGDKVLRMVAKTLIGNIRPFDFVGRWGGEEFVATVKNVDETTLRSIAEKLRALVEHSAIRVGRKKVSVTLSIGATMVRSGDTFRSILDRADGLMYQCKENGRNRVIMG